MYIGDNYVVWKLFRKFNKIYNIMELFILYCGRLIFMDFKINFKNLRLMSSV